jgi:hypothetical protein
MSANELPNINENKKKLYANEAVKIICTKGRTAAVLYLTNCMVQNARLVQEVNRLRALVNEEPLPEF